MSEPVARRPVTDAVLSHLRDGLTGVTVYDAEIPLGTTMPPATDDSGVAPDPSGRVAPYVVLFGGSGTPYSAIAGQEDLAESSQDLQINFLLHVAAGWGADCELLADRVHALLFRWTPTVDGVRCGRMVPPPGYDPGSVRKNETYQPPRFWMPLQFQLAVHR